MNKFLMTSAAVVSLVLGSAVAMAEDTAPLPAGGPAAQSESGPTFGSPLEIAGVVVAVTVAGLVAIDSDNDSLPPITPPPTTGTSSSS